MTAAGALAGPAPAAVLPPDLVQGVPVLGGVVVVPRAGGLRERLGFTSTVSNGGPGPLMIEAWRGTGATMTARQRLARPDGTTVPGPLVGRMRFVVGGGHGHWHLAGFERFELRTLAGRLQGRDHKTGFCLGDRSLAPGQRVAAAPIGFPRRCGLGHPELRTLVVGISPGWQDAYGPQLEGQYVDVTGLPNGDYWLVHRLDPQHRLRQTTRTDDVAGLRLRLRPALGMEAPGRHADPVAACMGTACPAAVRRAD